MRLPVLAALLAAWAGLAGCSGSSDVEALDVTGYSVSDGSEMRQGYSGGGTHVVTCAGDLAVHRLSVRLDGSQDLTHRDDWRIHSDGRKSGAVELEFWGSSIEAESGAGIVYVYACLPHEALVSELTVEVSDEVVARGIVDETPVELVRASSS